MTPAVGRPFRKEMQQMKGTIFWLVVATTMLLAHPSWGHGTRGTTEVADGIRLTARYDDGEPMRYAAVTVHAPDGDTEFQTGRTDRNGIFMFAPDQSGKWRVIVEDGIGHRLVVGRRIDPDEAATGARKPHGDLDAAHISRGSGLVSGVSLIFGLCGILYGFKARRHGTGENSLS